ncbi:hypothetical protein GX50_02201 [[Emmonsia] crescens]|uniref:Uncharacterized protein n=1 Tax=[Emmonsia] crescens TaxID=73230 RepID=A0A2B7ZP53_9EURO|nr:hypothetical protein GX50_02201 [Emmonsia crescens]
MAANFPQIPASSLGTEHFAALEQAIRNVISTELAFETFGQVVDGIPTRDAYFEYYVPSARPEYSQNLRPSNKASKIAAQAYQNTSLASRSFKLRLLELVAVACHNIAAELYSRADGGLRKPTSPQAPPPSSHPLIRAPSPNTSQNCSTKTTRSGNSIQVRLQILLGTGPNIVYSVGLFYLIEGTLVRRYLYQNIFTPTSKTPMSTQVLTILTV